MADLPTRYPNSPGMTAINFRLNTPTLTSETLSGKFRRVGMGISYYSWEAQHQNLSPLLAGEVKGYLAQCLGPQFSFEIILPQESFSNLNALQTSSTPQTSQSIAIGSKQVTLTNCGANGRVLAAGDFFKFANHSKVYMAVSAVTANSSGNATLFFTSPLVQAVPIGTNLTINAVPFTAVLADSEQEWTTSYGGFTNMSVPMREVWGT
jgi:hypothetical protein